MSKRERPPYGTSNLPIEFFEGKVEHPWRDPKQPFDRSHFLKWQAEVLRQKAERAAEREISKETKKEEAKDMATGSTAVQTP
jgi:hypothetical protein